MENTQQTELVNAVNAINADHRWQAAKVIENNGNLYAYDSRGVQRMIVPKKWVVGMSDLQQGRMRLAH